jgi:hypothetical protein
MDHSEVKHFPKVDHTPAELDEASKLLLKAADLIEKNGLNNKNYKYIHEDGSICVKCAINLADGGEPEDMNSFFQSRLDAIYRLDSAIGETAYEWILGRPQQEVVAKLRAVALSA